MKLIKFAPKKNVAQAMVEFAIVLPILLVLLYGLLEAGRLLFMYSSIVTASRQAVRYGAATGDGTTASVPRYQDCRGIRLAANRVDYLSAFDHTSLISNDVQISWDTGPGTTVTSICPAGSPSATWTPPSGNTTRLIVTVTGHFNAIVRLIPFPTRTITSTSSRTILMSVPIVVNPSGAQIPTISIAHAPNPSEVGEPVPVIVTLSGTAGVPTGTIDILVNGSVVTGCDGLALDAAGKATCNISFYTDGNISVDFTSTSADYQSTVSGTVLHEVEAAHTTTTIEDTPGITKPGVPTLVIITVRNDYDPNGLVIIPTGTVTVTNSEGGTCGTLALDAYGQASCTMTFAVEGFPIIRAEYSGDTNHDTSMDQEAHQVMIADPTVTNTSPPPTRTDTAPPPIETSTLPPPATPVVGCSNIKVPNGKTIMLVQKTMYLEIYNPMSYSVTVKDVFLRWNYLQGNDGSNLKLVSAQLNSTLGQNIFWQVPMKDALHAPSYSPPLSTAVIIPANSTSYIVFTFDKQYTDPSGEQIQISFSTPGCESHTINIIK